MDDYLTKPVDWKQVLTRIPAWTEARGSGTGRRPVPHDTADADGSGRPEDGADREQLQDHGGEGGEHHRGPFRLDPALFDPDVVAELASLPAQDVADIADAFVSTAPDTLRRLEEAVKAGDLTQADRLAHRLKGGCATIGAIRAAALCERIQELADTSPPTGRPEAGASTPLLGTLVELADEMVHVSEELLGLARTLPAG
jgi:HPt (histidine-containing phosphotransfer) domain-containing protein